MSQTSYLTFFLATFAILNPLNSLVILISLTKGSSQKERKKIAKITSISVFCILMLSLWCGADFLKFFDISIGAFTTAGGIIVFLIGLNMVRAAPSSSYNATMYLNKSNTIAIVPLAIPLTAGPGAISTVILHAYHMNTLHEKLNLSLICLSISLTVLLFLYFASIIAKLLGENGIKILGRIMGIILSAIGIQMIGVGLPLLLPF